MKITSASLQLASSHASSQQHEVSESLKMWVGPRRPAFSDEGLANRPQITDSVTLSDAGKAASGARATDEAGNDEIDNDPKLKLIRSLMELLTGRQIKVFNASELHSEQAAPAVTAPPGASSPETVRPAGYGVEYDYHESYTETEQTSFSASGKVTTADGRAISFDLQLSMSRSYHEESNVSLRLGDAARKTDPLVLNFSGSAAQLTNQRFAFDLNSDGSKEQINFVAPGSGFLVFDQNHDGKVNNGSELFGPNTGDGFQELAKLDDDKNGWIDENDAAFGQLQVWTRNTEGTEQLQSLGSAGVGAISLSRINTPFDIKTNANELLGKIRTSGILLQESGAAGTIQQIDLTA
ncbi:MAG: hypothetical protein H6R16_1659 [Proteobacteria bacterium]|nr:hypothetical protein [Pseudomonadota bacterium]